MHPFLKSITFSFLPFIVVMSASFPSVNEFVTDCLGVFDVTTKSSPFCCISTTGLMSLATLMRSSGNAVKKAKKDVFCYEVVC